MYKFLLLLVVILFSGASSADSKWVFYCPALKVFCSEVRHELKIGNPEISAKYSGIAFTEGHSWSSEVIFENSPTFKLEIEEGFCKNTYIYISFREATNTECKYIINEL